MLFAWLREHDPARARELLAATWKEESVKDRAAFLHALGTALGPDDEPFLETVLDDRGKDVRRVAADLLARLPDSALVQRMIARVRPLLRFERGSLTVTLPEKCTKEMQRDGVDLQTPRAQEQEPVFACFFQMLGKVPPSVLQAMLNAAPEDVVQAARQHEWQEEFFNSFMVPVCFNQDTAWARALLYAVPPEDFGFGETFLLSVLPPEETETLIVHFLQTLSWPGVGEHHPALFLLKGVHTAWSPALSRLALAVLRYQITTAAHKEDYQELCRFIKENIAYNIAPELLDEAAQGWDTEADSWRYIRKTVQDMLEVLHFRRAMREAFTE
jgi:hypothetical protein